MADDSFRPRVHLTRDSMVVDLCIHYSKIWRSKSTKWKQNFGTKKKKFFKTQFFGTCVLAEVLKNKFLWQSDHGLCHQTTVYRSQKFAKNQENLDILQWVPSYTKIKSIYSGHIKKVFTNVGPQATVFIYNIYIII